MWGHNQRMTAKSLPIKFFCESRRGADAAAAAATTTIADAAGLLTDTAPSRQLLRRRARLLTLLTAACHVPCDFHPTSSFSLLKGVALRCVRASRNSSDLDLERPTSYRTCTLRRSPRGRIAPLTSRAGRRRRPRCVRRHSPHHRCLRRPRVGRIPARAAAWLACQHAPSPVSRASRLLRRRTGG